MSTIRKTISFPKRDKRLQDIIKEATSYDVSHVVRQLMYDGLKYRALVERGIVEDLDVDLSLTKPRKKEFEAITPKKEVNIEEMNDLEEEIDLNSVKLVQIDEKDEDLEDILLKSSF